MRYEGTCVTYSYYISVIYLVHRICVQEGQSALHVVSSSNFDIAMEIVATLLKYGADLSAVNQARPRDCATCCHDTSGVLQDGETALQTLAKKFTGGNEAQLTEAIQKGQLIVAVKSGDIAGVQRCQGVDIHTRDGVCWATFDILVQPSHPC